MSYRSAYLDPDRPPLVIPSPPRGVREWVDASKGIPTIHREADGFARITLRNLDSNRPGIYEDPVRLAERLDAVAGRLAYAADRIREKVDR